MSLRVRKLDPSASLPEVDENGGGYLLYALEDVTVEQHQTRTVRTGVSVQIPDDAVGLIVGMKIHVHGGVLTKSQNVDRDGNEFANELVVRVHNHEVDAVKVVSSQPFAHLIITPIFSEEVEEVVEETPEETPEEESSEDMENEGGLAGGLEPVGKGDKSPTI